MWIASIALALVGRQDLPLVRGVELQPLAAQVARVVQALERELGTPLAPRCAEQLEAALALEDEAASLALQAALDPLCIALVTINPESRVKATRGPAPARLAQGGWSTFLVKVENQGGVRAPLRCMSPNAVGPRRSDGAARPGSREGLPERDRWLDIEPFDRPPLTPALSGLPLEYRVVSLYARDASTREAALAFDVGDGSRDLGGRSEVPVLFECAAAVEVELEVLDHDGAPTMACFEFRDERGHVLPSRARRLAPDMFFHDQIYRASGETIRLAPGDYEVRFTRGPEYVESRRTISVPPAERHEESFQLERWIELAARGWYSGDHHVHAAGCSHYDAPTQGITPADMLRQVLGEDLNVGCVLSWGPCWYFQKQFFSGEVSELSGERNLMRYDVEVSGFPSQHAGHLCLLRLTEDDYVYPEATDFEWRFGDQKGSFHGTRTSEIGEWPSWDLPILQWAQAQGAVVGFSHSGFGLQVGSDALPNLEMPPFDGIGANEYVVDVTHGAVDFISAVDTPSVWELNVWYHTLNCGFTTRISGETDYPCIFDERVGLGRSYVKLADGQDLEFDAWVDGVRAGRSYVSDGRSHLFDFEVNGLGVGEAGAGGRESVLSCAAGDELRVKVQAAARLAPEPRRSRHRPDQEIRALPLDFPPYWHVERARLGDEREVQVELLVNGLPVARRTIPADGSVQELEFRYEPERSSWIALRIYPSSHTNPVFVELDGEPIRASRASADWLRRAVDVCWGAKSPRIRPHERAAAVAAYDHARELYERIWSECPSD